MTLLTPAPVTSERLDRAPERLLMKSLGLVRNVRRRPECPLGLRSTPWYLSVPTSGQYGTSRYQRKRLVVKKTKRAPKRLPDADAQPNTNARTAARDRVVDA